MRQTKRREKNLIYFYLNKTETTLCIHLEKIVQPVAEHRYGLI